MKKVDRKLLAEFRKKRVCEFCNDFVPEGCDPHHVHTRGFGGGDRLDVRINLIALCPAGTRNECHRKAQQYRIKREELLKIIAKREGMEFEDLVAALHRLRRTVGKDAKQEQHVRHPVPEGRPLGRTVEAPRDGG